ncbi:Rossmann-fold NAD(P)-binding domain-containing protein [Aureivirga marina]|uniref:hypothetical protein n=1 Tax=Aureivirga marina TaxID=1182451 RepID=UPI0018C8FE5E|nr:hypothetical protein [Aureivirga marina]
MEDLKNNFSCVLGATGCIGIEITSHLLLHKIPVLAIVRSKLKLKNLLNERNISFKENLLKIREVDFFNNEIKNNELWIEIISCKNIFNCASPKIAYNPFSKINRNWKTPVSDLTKKIIENTISQNKTPHLFFFIGPEKFKQVDGSSGLFWGGISKITRTLIKALHDKYVEANFIINSAYKNWTIFRCGNVRFGSGNMGLASKVEMDLYKDKSNYQKGKGKSLIAEDLGSFVVNLIVTEQNKSLKGKLPFIFNVKF